jgi:large subunit ribosomal protein L4
MATHLLTAAIAHKAGIALTEGHKGSQALHDVVTALRANRRAGTAHTKRRGEVQGSGKKLWNQKGTGNARMGSRRSPIWSGGATVFGPRARDFSKRTSKKVRTLALQAALTGRVHASDIFTVDNFTIPSGKTKDFLSSIKGITEAKSILVISDNFDELTRRAGRNVGSVQLSLASEVNAETIIKYEKIVATTGAISSIAKRVALLSQ